MDVLTEVDGSWLGLNGSLSTKVQLAANDSEFEPDHAVGCTKGSPLKGELDRCYCLNRSIGYGLNSNCGTVLAWGEF